MSSETFAMIKYIDNIIVKKIYGKKISLKYPNSVDIKFIDLVSIVDWVPERISRLHYINKSNNIDIITTLCVLNSLTYSLKKANKIFGFEDNGYTNKITNLRQNWHNIKNNTFELHRIVANSKKIGERLMFEYSKHLKKNTDFIKSYKHIKNNQATLDLYLKDQIGIGNNGLVKIPNIFFYHFAYYASLKNSLSKKLNKRMIGFNKFDKKLINSKYRKIMDLKIINSNFDYIYLKHHNIKKGLIRFGYLI